MSDAPELTAEEREIVARFEAAEDASESISEQVVIAIHIALARTGGCRCGERGRLDCYLAADAAIDAMRPRLVTAPAHPDRQGAREELAAALHGYMTRAWSGHTEDDCHGIAAAIAPVVERLCDQRAAEALEEAADDDAEAFPGEVAVPTSKLRARAEALRDKP